MNRHLFYRPIRYKTFAAGGDTYLDELEEKRLRALAFANAGTNWNPIQVYSRPLTDEQKARKLVYDAVTGERISNPTHGFAYYGTDKFVPGDYFLDDYYWRQTENGQEHWLPEFTVIGKSKYPTQNRVTQTYDYAPGTLLGKYLQLYSEEAKREDLVNTVNFINKVTDEYERDRLDREIGAYIKDSARIDLDNPERMKDMTTVYTVPEKLSEMTPNNLEDILNTLGVDYPVASNKLTELNDSILLWLQYDDSAYFDSISNGTGLGTAIGDKKVLGSGTLLDVMGECSFGGFNKTSYGNNYRGKKGKNPSDYTGKKIDTYYKPVYKR